jgi:hypothetical protein
VRRLGPIEEAHVGEAGNVGWMEAGMMANRKQADYAINLM